MSSTQNFGAAPHAATVNAQNIAQGSSNEKSTVVVVLCPTVNGNQILRAEPNGNVVQTVAQGKAMNRITDLLAMGGKDQPILSLLGPTGGANAGIDERCKLKDSASVIIRYTVNGSTKRLAGMLSESLLKVAELAANDNTTLDSYASRFGVHAIAVTSEANSARVVEALAAQLEKFESNEMNFVPVLKATVEQMNAPVLDWTEARPDSIVLAGAALSFVVRSEVNRVNFLIKSIKGDKVTNPLDVFKRDNQTSVSVDEKMAALEAIGYDLTAMPDNEIAVSYEQERKDFLSGAGDAVSEDDSAEETEESESESLDLEEGDDEEAEVFNASEATAVILLGAKLDRAQLKKLVFMLGGKVFGSDTEETLTTKILELVEDQDYNEHWNFVMAANERLGGVSGFADYIHAESEAVDDDVEEEEEEEESEDDSETESEDDSESSDEEEDEEGEDEDAEEGDDEEEEEAEFDAPTEFLELLTRDGEIEIDEDLRPVLRTIARSEALNQKTYKNDTAEDIAERIVGALSLGTTAEEFENMIQTWGATPIVADAYPEWAEYEVNPVDYSELFMFEGAQLDHEQRIAALESVGVETEGLGRVAVLKAFDEYRLNNFEQDDSELDDVLDQVADEEAEAEDEESSDYDGEDSSEEEEEEEETEEGDEAEFDAEGEQSDDNDFIAESSTNNLGTFLRVRQEQTLLVNFALTDRQTFEGISDELKDQNGIDYRVPFNMTEDAEGSMYLPLTVISDVLAGSSALPFMSDRKTFNVESYAEKLSNTLRSQIDSLLYEGRLEAGQDPYSSGLVLGDFIEDENDFGDEEDLSPEYLNEMAGDHVPMASLYNAHVCVRPVTVETDSTVLNTAVLNIAMPCIWNLDKKKVAALVKSAYNRVVSHLGETDTKVYVGFTLNAGSLVSNETLRNVVKAISDMASDDVSVSSYSINDVNRINESDDILEAAHSIGTENLPLTLLCSGVAGAAFANGGDLVMLLSGVNDSDSDESDEEDESEE